MIESAPKEEKNVLDMEKGSDGVWRLDKDSAPLKVEELIGSVEGFDQLTEVEKISTLKALLSGIGDSKDRFMIEPLSLKIRAMEATEEYTKIMNGIGVEVGGTVSERV
jgi:hypothetical protein